MNCGKLQRGILLFKLVLCLIGMTFVPVAGHSQEPVSKFAPGHLPQRSNAKASLNPSIPLGWGLGTVLDVEVNPTTNRLYTLTYDVAGASTYLFSVLVFEGMATQPLAMIPVGTAATPATGFSLRVNHTTNKIYAGSPSSLAIIDGGSNSVLASLPGSFGRIEVNSVTNRVYATQTVGNSMFLTVIDGQTNNVLTSFPVQGQVVGVNSATNRVYVSVVTTGLSEIQVFDGGTNTLLTRIPNLAAYRMAVNPLTNRLYVASFGGSAITVLEGATHTILTTISLGPMAKSSGIVANPNTNRVYVFTHNENFAFVQGGVRVIDGGTNTVLGTLKSSVDGRELTSAGILKINPATGVLYLNKDGIPTVLTATESASTFTVAIQVDCVPFSLALNPVTRRLYVANYSGRTLFILNPENGQMLANLALGWSPGTVVVNAVTNRIYLRRDTTGTGDSASVVVLDGATLQPVATIANTGGMAALNSVTNRIYLDFGQVIDGNTNQVVPSQLFIAFPSVVGVNAQSRKIYLAKFDGIEVYDAVTEQLLTTIPRNLTPRDIAVDQVLNRVSVLDANGLLVIDGNRDVVIHSSAFSNGPSAKLDVNDNTHRLYLADGAGILKILDGNVYQVIQTLVYDPATGSSFNHLQVDSATSRLFLINTAGGSVFVIDDALPFTREPQIFAADPVFGPAGTVVTISGANLNTVTRVTFNGKPALFRIDSASQITATVPAGATTGPVVVTATNGAATGPVFTVVRTK